MAGDPRQADRPGITELSMRLERIHERLDESILFQRVEAVLPPDAKDPERFRRPIDAGLDAADEPIPEPDRQDVVAPSTLRCRDIDLPDVIEAEQRAQQLAVPDER